MVKNLGSATPGTYGDTARPLPRRDDSLPLHPVHTHTTKRAGLDWDALTPRCKLCDQPSHQLDDTALCPSCGGIAKPTAWKNATNGATRTDGYQTLTNDQVEQRYTPAADHTQTPAEAPRPAAAVEGAGAPATLPDAPATPTPTIRAKVTSPTPCDVVITLRSSDPIPTPQVAALLNDLLAGLQTSGVVAEPMERQSTVSTPPEDSAAPAPGKGKPDAGAAPKRRSRLTDNDKQRIAALYVDGWTYRDLTEKYGVSSFTIAAVVTAQGITPRPRGGNHPKKNGAHPA